MEINMTSNIQELRPKPPETEKITINLGYVDLGHVDLMVAEGFYSNRTHFIRTAIRKQGRASGATRCGGALSHSVAPPPRAAVIPEAPESAEQQ